ncbi:MAG: protein glxC [Gammaproteobacteria bacterium]|jgi:glutamate synthase domain-containing protein 3
MESLTQKGVDAQTFDLASTTVRELNQFLHHELDGPEYIEILNPDGQHSIAVGLDAPVTVDIHGHAGYFIAGMNKQASVTVHGNVGWSVGENIMSGSVLVKGNASECAGASGHGGLVVIEGDASSRCGISMKGCDIVVGGSVGHMSAFMAQAGHLVVCGDADHGLGDSLYEAVIYVRGEIHGLGADAQIEPMQESDYAKVAELLARAGFDHDPKTFKRVASARSLYHWNADHFQEY